MRKVLITSKASKKRPLLQQILCKYGHEKFIVFRAVDKNQRIGFAVCCDNCHRILFVGFEKPDGTAQVLIPPEEVSGASFLESVTGIKIDLPCPID